MLFCSVSVFVCGVCVVMCVRYGVCGELCVSVCVVCV